jgi:predicted enzyme related to lactoylglutathione lyase
MAESYGLTKLVVGDLEASIRFYGDVCGLREFRRIEAEVHGSPISESVMGWDPAAPAAIMLFQFHGRAAPTPGECFLVFYTDDIQAFAERVVRAGGAVTTPPTPLPGMSFALFRDPEGHELEAIQRTPG